MKNGGVHSKKYDGRYIKQWIRIPKVPWTSPILGKRSTCRTSFNNTSLMKYDVKVKVPNGTLKILIPSDGVANWDGVLKYGHRPEGDHAMHFLSWIKIPMTWNLVWKCSYANDIIERGLMMWMSSVIDGNRQEGKWLVVEHRALKWAKTTSGPPFPP